MNLTCPNGEIPVLKKEKTILIHAVKESFKSKVYSDTLEEQKKHPNTLLKYSNFLMFAEQERAP